MSIETVNSEDANHDSLEQFIEFVGFIGFVEFVGFLGFMEFVGLLSTREVWGLPLYFYR